MEDRKKSISEWNNSYYLDQIVKKLRDRSPVGNGNGIFPYPEWWPKVYNASNEPCDLLEGPCSCGAWHSIIDILYRIKRNYFKGDAEAFSVWCMLAIHELIWKNEPQK